MKNRNNKKINGKLEWWNIGITNPE